MPHCCMHCRDSSSFVPLQSENKSLEARLRQAKEDVVSKDRDIDSLRRLEHGPHPDSQSVSNIPSLAILRGRIFSVIKDLFSSFRDFVLPILPSRAQIKLFVLVLLIYTVYRKRRHASK